ncbi:hypothetical protein Y032_0541g3207 [Ancylostoma ceylanicum]|uniref:Uncharacterized protein n=1 Tax=Ancylostoma ceylanicum TaxID=53326 RepID=A0A016WQU2_9BILA|nr:hypothetical protein Y032_0541g3207 [Ancylostoma ceylanicum]
MGRRVRLKLRALGTIPMGNLNDACQPRSQSASIPHATIVEYSRLLSVSLVTLSNRYTLSRVLFLSDTVPTIVPGGTHYTSSALKT